MRLRQINWVGIFASGVFLTCINVDKEQIGSNALPSCGGKTGEVR